MNKNRAEQSNKHSFITVIFTTQGSSEKKEALCDCWLITGFSPAFRLVRFPFGQPDARLPLHTALFCSLAGTELISSLIGKGTMRRRRSQGPAAPHGAGRLFQSVQKTGTPEMKRTETSNTWEEWSLFWSQITNEAARLLMSGREATTRP